jgi:hypothetical protein
MGIILGPSEKGDMVDVGFYCKRVSGMELVSGFGIGAVVGSQAHRRCQRSVPWQNIIPTADRPPIHGAP